MVNFFTYILDKLCDEKNIIETGVGFLLGSIFSGIFLINSNSFIVITWESIIISFGTMIGGVVGAVLINIGKDFYEYKIKNKIFKNKRNAKKTDIEKRA